MARTEIAQFTSWYNGITSNAYENRAGYLNDAIDVNIDILTREISPRELQYSTNFVSWKTARYVFNIRAREFVVCSDWSVTKWWWDPLVLWFNVKYITTYWTEVWYICSDSKIRIASDYNLPTTISRTITVGSVASYFRPIWLGTDLYLFSGSSVRVIPYNTPDTTTIPKLELTDGSIVWVVLIGEKFVIFTGSSQYERDWISTNPTWVIRRWQTILWACNYNNIIYAITSWQNLTLWEIQWWNAIPITTMYQDYRKTYSKRFLIRRDAQPYIISAFGEWLYIAWEGAVIIYYLAGGQRKFYKTNISWNITSLIGDYVVYYNQSLALTVYSRIQINNNLEDYSFGYIAYPVITGDIIGNEKTSIKYKLWHFWVQSGGTGVNGIIDMFIKEDNNRDKYWTFMCKTNADIDVAVWDKYYISQNNDEYVVTKKIIEYASTGYIARVFIETQQTKNFQWYNPDDWWYVLTKISWTWPATIPFSMYTNYKHFRQITASDKNFTEWTLTGTWNTMQFAFTMYWTAKITDFTFRYSNNNDR